MSRRHWSSVARCLLAAVLLLQASLFPASGLAVRPVSAAAAASLTEPEAPTASPDPTLNSTFDSPLQPPADTPQIAALTLALQVTPNWVEPGDVLTVTVTAAAGAASDLAALVIQDTLPAGLLYVTGSARGFESTASENALTWQVPKLTAGTIITGSFQARVQGLALGATVSHTVTATTAQPPAAASSTAVAEIVSPGNNDVEVAPRQAGWLRSTDDRVLLRVPAQLTAATRFSYRARPDVPNPPEGLAYAFTLNAAAADGSVAQRLTAPVQLKVHYPRTARGTPQLLHYNETAGTWQPLDVPTAASTAEIQAAVDYGGTFAVAATSSTPDTITPQLSQIRGAQAALYSRAINYQYDLALPPGRGGLAPNYLALRYQSPGPPPHDRLLQRGWAWLATGRADAVYTDGQERFATLVLRGQSYSLVFIEGSNGVWVAKEDPFLKITHTVNVNCCDWDANSWAWSEWWVTTRDGLRYHYYGKVGKDAANQWSALYPMATQWGCSPRYTSYRDHLGVIVPLVEVQDPQGNQITYTWATSGWAQYNEVQNHECVPDQNVVAGLYIRKSTCKASAITAVAPAFSSPIAATG